MMPSSDQAKSFITQVAAAALANFPSIMQDLGLSDGKFSGPEYLPLNPLRSDRTRGSLSINRTSGVWQEFATDDKGGDLVSLAAYLRQCSQWDAAASLAPGLGIAVPDRKKRESRQPPAAKGKPATPPKTSPKAPPPTAGAAADSQAWRCIVPAPENAPPAPLAHPTRGKPARRYAYRTPAGRTAFFVDRYESSDGKSFAQLTTWQNAAGRIEWRWKAPPAPRLLYGLELLTAKPDAPVIVAEGEKAAEAARLLAPDFVCIAWPGGAQALAHVDWAPLAGRDVTLWPDLDEPGAACVEKLAVLLAALPQPPAALHQVRPAAFGLTSKGTDAADLIGWDAARFADACTSDTWREALPLPAPTAKVGKTTAREKPRTAPPVASRYRLGSDGVYLLEADRDGNVTEKWVCSYLEPLARVRTSQNTGWGLLVELEDADGMRHRLVLPMLLFRGDGLEVAGMLLDAGLTMAPGARPRVISYLQTARPAARARLADRTGWHATADGDRVYVTPDRTFGADSEVWRFETESAAAHACHSKGTAADWANNLGKLCRGNSRLLFAVSVAFAAPTLYLVGGESGGFHFRSNSSDGKTTALKVACSVCGNDRFMQRWRATDNGLEALAMQYCDSLLALDELAQIDPKSAGESSYLLANGAGKARATRTGSARAAASWRLLFLSAGEISLAQHMSEAGRTTHAGQEVRLADIPADAGAGLGAWENLHGHPNGSEFARALERETRRSHGAPMVAFLEQLTANADDLPAILQDAQKRFAAEHLTNEASGQARRVADRFALVALGGELATDWGLTGWQTGEALAAAGTCFKAWLAGRGGEGNQEEAAMLNQVREFLERYGDGAFDLWHRMGDDRSARTTDRAGVRRWILPDGKPVTNSGQITDDCDGAEYQTEYFVFEQTWRTRVCKGRDPKALANLLAKHGALTHNKGRLQSRVRLPGIGQTLVYHITPTLFEGADNA